MGDAAKDKARDEAQQAQAEYEAVEREYEARIAPVRAARREKFKKAQDAGMTLREIAEAVGLHNTRVGQILREE